MKKILAKIRKNKIQYLILLLIILVGIYFRTYHFSEWTRFSDDQGRDAGIIRDIIQKGQSLPLLGPVAGTSNFYLGPVYYYFLFFTAKIFGSNPAVLGYPVLFLSILSIPLLYLFFKKYFSGYLSLALTALFAVSYFVITFSRFSWNPNTLPFFVLLFLYSLLELTHTPKKREIFWSILAGTGMGIGVQLHTIFLVVAPAVFITFFIYGIRKKILTRRSAVVVLLVAIFFNIPQLISEIKTGGENSKVFVTNVLSPDSSITVKKTVQTAFCHVQANSEMLTYYGYAQKCDYFKPPPIVYVHNTGKPEPLMTDRQIYFGGATLMFLFSILGYLLIFYNLRREKEKEKKYFLVLVAMFAIASFITFIPVINDTRARYFIFFEFMPFLLAGMLAKFVLEKANKYVALAIIAAGVLAIGWTNLQLTAKSFQEFEGQGTYAENNDQSTTLGEEEYLANFIIENRGDSQVAYLDGDANGLGKVMTPIQYFFRDIPDLEVKSIDKAEDSDKNVSYFKAFFVGSNNRNRVISQPSIRGREILKMGSYARYVIYKIGPPKEDGN
jgi:4-amino-4-deoxy-L-arabinose transferase-like glycosyltransferase